MGTNCMFYPVDAPFGLEQVIIDHIDPLTKFYEQELARIKATSHRLWSSYKDLYTYELLDFMQEVQKYGVEHLKSTDLHHAKQVDRLTDAFRSYCYRNEIVLNYDEAIGFLNIFRFQKCEDWLRQTYRSEQFIHLWQYIYKGRGIGRDDELPYQQSLDCYSCLFGFWTYAEIEAMLEECYFYEKIDAGIPESAYYSGCIPMVVQACEKAFIDGKFILICVS
ncbi:MAG: hypothetical protein AAF267_07670 [Deinococcota bacterium]